jgi:Mn-dependent DtxR family transcriptional regulator
MPQRLSKTKGAERLESQAMELTSTHLHYLTAIYELSHKTVRVTSGVLSRKLGIRQASVSAMLRVLMEKKLLVKENYGSIFLTDAGFLAARRFGRNRAWLIEHLPALGLPMTDQEIYHAAEVLATAFPAKDFSESETSD